MAFVSDTFTDTDGVNLSSHAGETGAIWTNQNAGTEAQINANRAAPNSTTATTYYHTSGTPANADYDVQATFLYVGSPPTNGGTGITGRHDTAAPTFYHVRWSPGSTQWNLYKAVSGTFTSLGTSTTNPLNATNASRVVKLEMRGTAIKVFVAGTAVISATDPAITAAGKAGVRFFRGGTATNGYLFDDFTATDAASGAALTQSVADALAVADAPRADTAQATTDALALTDARAIGTAALAADALTLTDAARVDSTLAPSDAVAIGDSHAATLDVAAADTLALGDLPASNVTTGASDAIATTDNLTFGQVGAALEQAISDALAAIDATASTTVQTLSDVAAATDAAIRAIQSAVNEALTAADSVTRDARLTAADTAALQDTLQSAVTGMSLEQALSDAAPATDNHARFTAVVTADALAAQDTLDARSSLDRALAEILAVTDAVDTLVPGGGVATITRVPPANALVGVGSPATVRRTPPAHIDP